MRFACVPSGPGEGYGSGRCPGLSVALGLLALALGACRVSPFTPPALGRPHAAPAAPVTEPHDPGRGLGTPTSADAPAPLAWPASPTPPGDRPLAAPPFPSVPEGLGPCIVAAPPCPPGLPRVHAGVGGNLIPNAGLGVHAGVLLARSPWADWFVEAEGIWQFLDDETLADDGNPAAGDWTQVKAGLKARFAPAARRHLVVRGGATWFRARGEPNIVDRPGDYFGPYVGVGFETDLTPNLSLGPELSLSVDTDAGSFKEGWVPQFAWRLTWWPGAGLTHARRPLPTGEVYAGAALLLSPSVGGGLEFGQAFHRGALATWYFEGLVGLQDLSDALWSEGDGTWAQLRGGVKVALHPCARSHPTGRLGFGWLRNTADVKFLDEPGDYLTAHVGVGWEFDIGTRFGTGPELALILASKEGEFDVQVVPQLVWHFFVKL